MDGWICLSSVDCVWLNEFGCLDVVVGGGLRVVDRPVVVRAVPYAVESQVCDPEFVGVYRSQAVAQDASVVTFLVQGRV